MLGKRSGQHPRLGDVVLGDDRAGVHRRDRIQRLSPVGASACTGSSRGAAKRPQERPRERRAVPRSGAIPVAVRASESHRRWPSAIRSPRVPEQLGIDPAQLLASVLNGHEVALALQLLPGTGPPRGDTACALPARSNRPAEWRGLAKPQRRASSASRVNMVVGARDRRGAAGRDGSGAQRTRPRARASPGSGEGDLPATRRPRRTGHGRSARAASSGTKPNPSTTLGTSTARALANSHSRIPNSSDAELEVDDRAGEVVAPGENLHFLGARRSMGLCDSPAEARVGRASPAPRAAPRAAPASRSDGSLCR